MNTATHWLLAPLLLAAPAPVQVGGAEAPLAAERVAILELAERFASVVWTAEERHLLHGDDPDGVPVDTPDVRLDPTGWRVGEGNVGMPYCWGGFTSLEAFPTDLAGDSYAGHVPARGNAMSSQRTLGVDCSGLVSRCWRLPAKQSTRSLGALCYELDDYSELLPGDIVNRFDAHVALFTGWADDERTTLHVIEAARIKVAPATYTVELLRSQDYRPMRYKLLDERWRAMPEPDPVPENLRREFVLEHAGADLDDPLPATVRAGQVRPGAWSHFDATENDLRGPGVTSTWMAVEGAAGTLELQRRLDAGTDTLATGGTLDLRADWVELLVEAANFSNPLQNLTLVTRSLDAGTYHLGESQLPARRVTALVEGQMLSRSTLYPVVLQLECVISDEVALLGLCELNLRLEVDYGTREDGERVVGGAERAYALIAHGDG